MHNPRSWIKNIATMLFCISMLGTGCVLLPEEVIPTPTSSPTPGRIFIPPTATCSVIETGETPAPTDTSIPEEPTATIEPIPTDTLVPTSTETTFPYNLQPGTPAQIRNYAHPTAACDWIGVAGQIFGGDGAPVLNQVVLVTGQYNEVSVNLVGVTGTVEGDIYGPGGYEIVLGNIPIASTNLLKIQAFDLNGIPISEETSFNTFADCEKNLIIINYSAP